MKFILSIMLLVSSISVFAVDTDDINSAGFRSLSEVDKVEIIKTVAEKSKQPTTSIKTEDILTTLENTDKWVGIGTSLGRGLAATAKELGIAANDLANTRLGMIVTTLIVWNFLGAKILDVIGGIILLIVGLYLCKVLNITNINYSDQTNWLGFKRIKSIQYNESSDWMITIMIARFTILLISIALIV
jgi:hypothetical protein